MSALYFVLGAMVGWTLAMVVLLVVETRARMAGLRPDEPGRRHEEGAGALAGPARDVKSLREGAPRQPHDCRTW